MEGRRRTARTGHLRIPRPKSVRRRVAAGLRGAPRLLPGRDERWGLGAISGPPISIAERHGFAGARRTLGGWGAISGPPFQLSSATAFAGARRTLGGWRS